MSGFVAAAPPALLVSLDELKAEARISTSEEDALLAGFARAAAELCESFIGTLLIARPVNEILPAGTSWMRLGAMPVRTIEAVATVGRDGVETVLNATDYAVDIDAAGEGWVRLLAVRPERRLKVGYIAGLASEPNGVPEALRQGVACLALYSFARRDAAELEAPPAAITALWRPWRRLRLGCGR